MFLLLNTHIDEVIFLNVTQSTATFLYLSWSPASGVPVTTYDISYTNSDKRCFDDSKTITVDKTTQNSMLEVQEYTEYFIKVTVSHKHRVIGSNVTVVTTHPVGVFTSTYSY